MVIRMGGRKKGLEISMQREKLDRRIFWKAIIVGESVKRLGVREKGYLGR